MRVGFSGVGRVGSKVCLCLVEDLFSLESGHSLAGEGDPCVHVGSLRSKRLDKRVYLFYLRRHALKHPGQVQRDLHMVFHTTQFAEVSEGGGKQGGKPDRTTSHQIHTADIDT